MTRTNICGPAEWIAKRRELLAAATDGPWAPWLDQDGASHMAGLLMVGNAAAVIPEGETWVEGVEVCPVAHVYTPEDRALVTDARTALPRALDALEAVLAPHQVHEVPGRQRWCLHCGGDWPCPTVAVITGALT